jgi:hypothetical protein
MLAEGGERASIIFGWKAILTGLESSGLLQYCARTALGDARESDQTSTAAILCKLPADTKLACGFSHRDIVSCCCGLILQMRLPCCIGSDWRRVYFLGGGSWARGRPYRTFTISAIPPSNGERTRFPLAKRRERHFTTLFDQNLQCVHSVQTAPAVSAD